MRCEGVKRTDRGGKYENKETHCPSENQKGSCIWRKQVRYTYCSRMGEKQYVIGEISIVTCISKEVLPTRGRMKMMVEQRFLIRDVMDD